MAAGCDVSAADMLHWLAPAAVCCLMQLKHCVAAVSPADCCWWGQLLHPVVWPETAPGQFHQSQQTAQHCHLLDRSRHAFLDGWLAPDAWQAHSLDLC
jgi:hypothetical protein